MTAILNIINNFSLLAANGQTFQGAQGPIANLPSTPINLANVSLTGIFGSPSFQGVVFEAASTLATATALKVWDTAVMKPATWNYFFIWADQPLYVQFITSATNFIAQILPAVPFVMSVDGVLAAANTTPMSGSAPTLVAVSTVYIQNNSGTTANWQAAAIL